MKTLREAKLDKSILRLVEHNKSYTGLVIAENAIRVRIEGEKADDVWRRLHDEAGKANPGYFGYDGARMRFLRFFPNGCQSEGYSREERDYKLAAKSKLDAAAPLDKARDGEGFGEAVLAAYRATNLLSPFEKTRLQDVLRGPNADRFVTAAARFASGEGKKALLDMTEVLKPHDSAKWTVVTYLPFLWRPEAHMFLKPEVTKDFASRVGHRFAHDYSPQLDMPVYESLLDLVQRTEKEIADLQPRDRIDIQSFIWVVGDYNEDEQQPKV